MSEHPKAEDEPEPEAEREKERNPEKVITADHTAPGVGEVEIGGESLDP